VRADGGTIDFKLDLALCHKYPCERKTVEGGTAERPDPLGINFSEQGAELSSTAFSFDLDHDGRSESLHALAGDSAFLAVDPNGDGRINDGEHCSERHQATDAPIWRHLIAMATAGSTEPTRPLTTSGRCRKMPTDRDSLVGLKDMGVGALYLGSAETPRAPTDDNNRLHRQMREWRISA